MVAFNDSSLRAGLQCAVSISTKPTSNLLIVTEERGESIIPVYPSTHRALTNTQMRVKVISLVCHFNGSRVLHYDHL